MKTRSQERAKPRRHGQRGVAQPSALMAGYSATDLMLRKLDHLRQRLCEESKDVEELMALSEAIRIVRIYFGK